MDLFAGITAISNGSRRGVSPSRLRPARRGRRPDSELEVFELLAYLTRRARTEGFFAEHTELENLQMQGEALLKIHARELELQASARERLGRHRVAMASAWLSVALRALVGLTVAGAIILTALRTSGADLNETIRSVLNDHLALGGAGVIAVGAWCLGLKRGRSARSNLPSDDEPCSKPPAKDASTPG